MSKQEVNNYSFLITLPLLDLKMVANDIGKIETNRKYLKNNKK
jgi:hypothetical protein